MDKDEIIRMAKESGAVERYFGNQLHGIAFHKKEWLERFAAIVAAHEREACAKVCEDIGGGMSHPYVAQNCAATIRARGK